MDRVEQFEINRRIVQDGLNRRAEQRARAARETTLETYEADMIRACNDRHEVSLLQKKADDVVRECRDRCNHNIAERARAKAQKWSRRKDLALGCLSYFAVSVLMHWLTTWTYLPVWGAVTAQIGFLPILIAHVYLLYNPPAERKEEARER